jgi:hypothetical protein
MNRLYAVMQKIEERVNGFYSQTALVHENQKLRSLAKPPLQVVKSQNDYELYYGSDGFYIDDGDGEKTFHKKCDKLVADTDEGVQEMLEIFPKLTLGTIEDRLCAGLEKNHLPGR